MKTVAIILNTPTDIPPILEKDVICADAGLKHFNGTPIAVVGDFDSLEKIPDNIKKFTYPVEKDETDGQLALDVAKKLNYDHVVIYGALGGRIDHVLGNLGLLMYAKEIGISAEIREVNVEIALAENTFERDVNVGDIISFYPLFSECTVKSSTGLYYPYRNLTLSNGTNRGISNKATDKKICLKITSGTLLYIRYF